MPFTRDEAIRLCDLARAKNAGKPWRPGYWQCWGCMKFGGEPEKRCMYGEGSWDNCPQVNAMAGRA